MQRKFSLGWRKRRDASVERLIIIKMRLYSRKVERYAITNKARLATLTHTLKLILPTRRYIRRNSN
jgi:hypothetical protein